MSIALRFSSCHENALEIANDSFLKIFLKKESHRIEKDFKASLRTRLKDLNYNDRGLILHAQTGTVTKDSRDQINLHSSIRLKSIAPLHRKPLVYPMVPE